jgi:hypothetical protein
MVQAAPVVQASSSQLFPSVQSMKHEAPSEQVTSQLLMLVQSIAGHETGPSHVTLHVFPEPQPISHV